MKEKINKYLESPFSDKVTKLHYIKDIFKLMQFKHLDKDMHQWLNRERENFEIIDLYLEYINTLEMSLGYFKNISNLDDSIELKALLKKLFFCNETKEEEKFAIVCAVSSFLQPLDKVFLEKVILEFCDYKNFDIANNIFREASNGLDYLRDSNSFNSGKQQFWVNENNGADEHGILMYNDAIFFLWTTRNTNENVPNLAYAGLIASKLLNKYTYRNKLFPLPNGKDVGCNIEYNIFQTEDKKIEINLLLLVEGKVYINENNLGVISFIETISELLNLTNIKRVEYYENGVIPESIILELKNNISDNALITFTLQFIKSNKDFAITICTKNNASIKLDSVEINNMFEELVFHLAIMRSVLSHHHNGYPL